MFYAEGNNVESPRYGREEITQSEAGSRTREAATCLRRRARVPALILVRSQWLNTR